MNTATKQAPKGATPQQQQGGDAAAVAKTPFVRASRKARTPFLHESTPLASVSRQVGPHDVVARGFMRHLVVDVELSGGDDGAGPGAVVADNGPWGVLEQVRLTDPAGGPIVSISGWNLYLANKYLGLNPALSDPKLSPTFTPIDADGNGRYTLRVPVEISARDALGALANRNASSTYRVEYTLGAVGSVFSTPPSVTPPTVTVRMWLEYWTPTNTHTFDGRPNATEPPSHGTIQFHSQVPYQLPSGSNKTRLQRTGNYLRALLCTFRVAGARSTVALPDDIALTYDGVDEDRISKTILRGELAERLGLDGAEDAAGGLDTGVFAYLWDCDLDGRPGYGTRNELLPTTTGTDLRIEGDYGSEGVLEVCTIDVVPQGPIFAGV